MSTSLITPGHVRAFQAVTTQLYGEVTLASCLINGKPGVELLVLLGEWKAAGGSDRLPTVEERLKENHRPPEKRNRPTRSTATHP
jgi:hypothetical protein